MIKEVLKLNKKVISPTLFSRGVFKMKIFFYVKFFKDIFKRVRIKKDKSVEQKFDISKMIREVLNLNKKSYFANIILERGF